MNDRSLTDFFLLFYGPLLALVSGLWFRPQGAILHLVFIIISFITLQVRPSHFQIICTALMLLSPAGAFLFHRPLYIHTLPLTVVIGTLLWLCTTRSSIRMGSLIRLFILIYLAYATYNLNHYWSTYGTIHPFPETFRWFVVEVSRVSLGIFFFVLWSQPTPDPPPPWRSLIQVFGTLSSVFAIAQTTFNIHFMNFPYWARLHRAGGLMFDANEQGMLSVFALGLAFDDYLTGKSKPARFTFYALLLLGGLFASGSRAALLWFVIQIFGLVVYPTASVRKQSRCLILGILTLSLTLVLSWAVISRAALWLRMKVEMVPHSPTIPVELRNLAGLRSRLYFWNLALHIIRTHPWVGIGPGRYHDHALEVIKSRGDTHLPDNTLNVFFDQFAEFGIPLTLAFAALIIQWIYPTWKVMNPWQRAQWLGYWIAACFTPVHHATMTAILYIWGSQSLLVNLQNAKFVIPFPLLMPKRIHARDRKELPSFPSS